VVLDSIRFEVIIQRVLEGEKEDGGWRMKMGRWKMEER